MSKSHCQSHKHRLNVTFYSYVMSCVMYVYIVGNVRRKSRIRPLMIAKRRRKANFTELYCTFDFLECLDILFSVSLRVWLPDQHDQIDASATNDQRRIPADGGRHTDTCLERAQGSKYVPMAHTVPGTVIRMCQICTPQILRNMEGATFSKKLRVDYE
jgi:hypothetical protein